MAETITQKGIQRNASKLAVEDGRAEDLINLRFKDGSWRTSGDGMQVFEMTTGNVYEQLYIHTHSPYRHLLGVKEVSGVRKLYWFANIADDAVTVTPLTEPEEICTVADGDLYINQNGNLITIIDSADDFEYAVFKTGDEKYHIMDVDSNGAKDSRNLYPFGQVHCNIECQWDDEHVVKVIDSDAGHIEMDSDGINISRSGALLQTNTALQLWHSSMLKAFSKAKEKNLFTGPFLSIIAIKLYDGKYLYTSQPMLNWGREKLSSLKYIEFNNTQNINDFSHVGYAHKGFNIDTSEVINISGHNFYKIKEDNLILCADNSGGIEYGSKGYVRNLPLYTSCAYGTRYSKGTTVHHTEYDWNDLTTEICGSRIALSIADYNKIKSNADIISGISIFVTREANIFDVSSEGYKNGGIIIINDNQQRYPDQVTDNITVVGNATYSPKRRSDDEIIFDLTHSPFYLLREYSVNELSQLQDNPIVDLSGPEYKGLLENITQQPTLDYESQGRLTYIPRVSYNYNGKLHIADYTSIQFHGYPLDCFHLHNHSLKYEEGASFEGILPNLSSNNDEYFQFPKTKHTLLTSNEVPSVIVRVTLDTASGEQVVCRYIKGDDFGVYNFIEDLNQLITFPDSRAKKMSIYIYVGKELGLDLYRYQVTTFHKLKPHPYMNLAYYISSDLKPNQISGQEYYTIFTLNQVNDLLVEVNNEERVSNGLKVSLTDNPFFFPVEQAYQIGQGRIIAMCSNAIAVGTGQTGAAPLYVFCTDGIYALYVDASGQMAYTNARIIARDVCNNSKSVTPIDTGVVFTTDRGLMEIAGDVVNEIGQPAEGDVVVYTEPDWAKPKNVGKNMLTKVANLPIDIVDGVDFLTYLTGAIINYNHNERELMISNPEYPYTYVLDRYTNWSRRDYAADEYVNNYPTSYRVKDGVLYKVDAEQEGLEGKSEAPNKFLYLSNVIKLGTVDFKKAYRFVVRGKFNTNNGTENKVVGVYVFGSYDGRQFAMLGANEKKGTFTDIGCKIERTDIKYFRVGLAGHLSGDSRIDFMEIEGEQSNLTTKLR